MVTPLIRKNLEKQGLYAAVLKFLPRVITVRIDGHLCVRSIWIRPKMCSFCANLCNVSEGKFDLFVLARNILVRILIDSKVKL